MDKKQHIEEMAHLFCEYFKNSICKVKLKECDIDCGFAMTAEKIYTAGYRKIDDDCAVITKAELKQYKEQAVKEFAEKLKTKLFEFFQDNEGLDGKISVGTLYVDIIGIEATDGAIISLGLIDRLLKE